MSTNRQVGKGGGRESIHTYIVACACTTAAEVHDGPRLLLAHSWIPLLVSPRNPGSLDKDADGLLSVNINMNYFTDSAALQQVSRNWCFTRYIALLSRQNALQVRGGEWADDIELRLRIYTRNVDNMPLVGIREGHNGAHANYLLRAPRSALGVNIAIHEEQGQAVTSLQR